MLDGLFETAGRPTPPNTPNEDFYPTSYWTPPSVRVADWRLRVTGLVARPLTLRYDELLARPSVQQVVTLECVGNTVGEEFMSTAVWQGVPLGSLLEEAEPSPQAHDLVFRAADGYADSFTLVRVQAGDVLIGHRMNAVPLPQAHGFPARIIAPGHYGMKSVQRLTDVEGVAEDFKGYYQRKGWTEQDDIPHPRAGTR